jgi:hypothetical protein
MSAQSSIVDARAEARDDPPLAITRPVDALLRAISERFPLLACATPVDAAREQARLVSEWSRGREVSPRWTAPTIDRAALRASMRDVDRAHGVLAPSSDAWLRAYAHRLAELSCELEVIEAAFGASVTSKARKRFALDAAEAREADALAKRWIDASPQENDAPTIVTCDEQHPASLVQQMRRAISSRSIGARVVVRDRIGALAAAGDGVVVVARARRATEREAARVVMHEIEGHVLPRERGRGMGPGLCASGSAGASEDEEGRALVLEENAGMLDDARKRTLAARHLAATHVDRGASFVEVARTLRDAHRLAIDDALAITTRVMRGAFERDGEVRGGVMRERVYLPAYLRVTRAVTRDKVTLHALGAARLSIATRADLGDRRTMGPGR